MIYNQDSVVVRREESILATNRVLRNTYLLLGLSLLFSAFVASFAIYTGLPQPGVLITILGMYGLLFLTQALRNSGWGLLSMFAFTGFMGYSLVPLLDAILANFVNGSILLTTAFGATGVIFLGLSAYALITRKDFNYLSGFIFALSIIGLLLAIGGAVFGLPLIQLVVSGIFALSAAGLILFQTSLIINGGERNYISATLGLFVALYNLFVSLLQIFAAFAGERK